MVIPVPEVLRMILSSFLLLFSTCDAAKFRQDATEAERVGKLRLMMLPWLQMNQMGFLQKHMVFLSLGLTPTIHLLTKKHTVNSDVALKVQGPYRFSIQKGWAFVDTC